MTVSDPKPPPSSRKAAFDVFLDHQAGSEIYEQIEKALGETPSWIPYHDPADRVGACCWSAVQAVKRHLAAKRSENEAEFMDIATKLSRMSAEDLAKSVNYEFKSMVTPDYKTKHTISMQCSISDFMSMRETELQVDSPPPEPEPMTLGDRKRAVLFRETALQRKKREAVFQAKAALTNAEAEYEESIAPDSHRG